MSPLAEPLRAPPNHSSHGNSPEAAAASEAALTVRGMNCASCVAHVERAAKKVAGVRDCRVNLARGRAEVSFDPAATDANAVARAITQSGYDAQPQIESAGGASHQGHDHSGHDHSAGETSAWFRRAVIATVLWVPLELLHLLYAAGSGHGHHVTWMDWTGLVAGTLAVPLVGAGFYRGAWKGLRVGVANMDTLIAMGASVAYLYSAVAMIGVVLGAWSEKPPLYFSECIGLFALVSWGHWLEARARQSAGSAIRELLDLAPAVARRVPEGDGEPVEVPVAELVGGDRVLVRPGDRVPIDGVILEGRSGVDESMISGEPLPVTRSVGEPVIGGTINQEGRLLVRVTKTGSETALSQIVKLVETAQGSKPPVQRLADRVAAVFVPAVLLIALATGVGWYWWGVHANWQAGQTWGQIAKTVCAVLIIACPCALGLAIPAALMVGTGRGAKRGILIRDIDALQSAEKIDTVVLDKTGTLTEGKPHVVTLRPEPGVDEATLLRRAATAEQFSSHPLAAAIVAEARSRAALPDGDVAHFENVPGLGVIAKVEGGEILVGGRGLTAPERLDSGTDAGTGRSVEDAAENTHPTSDAEKLKREPYTTVWVAWREPSGVRPLGQILLADRVKPDSAEAVGRLRAAGLRLVLLTGDHAAAARAAASEVAIEDIRADVRPADKAAAVRALQENPGGARRVVAMVGDGINDAPALAQADLGIAIGSGSDVAKEAGDIVLVGGSLNGVATAIRLSRATMRIVRQNLVLAFVYNVVAIPLAAFGVLPPLAAALCMALSDVSVIGNALRLRRKKLD